MTNIFNLIPQLSGNPCFDKAFSRYGLWVWDISLDLLYFDSNIFSMYELGPEYEQCAIDGTGWYVVNYKSFELLVAEEDHKMIWDRINKAISSHSMYDAVFRINTAKGQKYINSQAITGYINGEPLYMSGINCDVTTLHKFDVRTHHLKK